MPDGTPLTPIMAQHKKMNYSVKINVHMNLSLIKDKKLITNTSITFDLTEILIPIHSRYCTLSTADSDKAYDPEGHIKSECDALRRHAEDLAEYNEGIFIINGVFYSMILVKDMNTNTLFSNVHESMTGDVPKYTLYNNILCEALNTNSVNSIFILDSKKDGEFVFTWAINSPPIKVIKLPFVALFYMIGIFNESSMINNINKHIKEDHRDECNAYLKILIENSDMRDIDTMSKFKAVLFEECQSAKIIKVIENMYSNVVNSDIIFNLFQLRFFPHISGTNVVKNKVNLICSTITEILTKYINIEPQKAKRLISRERQSFEWSRIDTATNIYDTRFTRAMYKYWYIPINNYLFEELKASGGDISILKRHTAEDLLRFVNLSEISSYMTSPTIERTNIESVSIFVQSFNMIDGKSGIMGRSIKTTSIKMFREYAQEGANPEMRKIGYDSVGFICPLATAEGNPGMNRQPTMCMILSFIEADKEEIKQIIMNELILCDHDKHTMIIFDTIMIGTHCCPKDIVTLIRKIRRRDRRFRFISMSWNVKLNKFSINYKFGHPFIPLFTINHNYNEHVNSLGKVPFKSNLKMTRDIYYSFMNGKLTLDDLIDLDIVEYVSADEMSFSKLMPSLEVYEKNKNDPLQIADYVMFNAMHLCAQVMVNPCAHKVTAQRTIFSFSQSKAICGPGQCTKTTIKKSSEMDDPHESNYVNISTRFMQATSLNLCTVFMGDVAGEEEGSIINQHAMSRGLGMEYMHDKIHLQIKNGSKLLQRSEINNCPNHIDANGLPKIGTILVRDSAIVYVTSSQDNSKITIEKHKQDLDAVVIGSKIIQHKGNKLIIEVCFVMRIPLCKTSKIAHITSNKSIISKNASPIDMPCFENGMVPSLIMSPVMSLKRNINDDEVNSNTWACLETGRQPYYGVFNTIPCVETSDDFKERMGEVGFGTFRMISMFGKHFKVPIHASFVVVRRPEKFGTFDSFITTSPRIDDAKNQPARGGKGQNGSMNDPEMNKQAKNTMDAMALNGYLVSDRVYVAFCKLCRGRMINHKKMGYFCIVCNNNMYDIVPTAYATNQLLYRTLCCRVGMTPKTFMPGFENESGLLAANH